MPLCKGVGYKKIRLVMGKDENMEKYLAFSSCFDFCADMTIYDNTMRKFIKDKFDIDIESPLKKWSRQCWNCGAKSEKLKTCSKCFIAQYCSKDCQVQDWTVHKELHAMVRGL